MASEVKISVRIIESSWSEAIVFFLKPIRFIFYIISNVFKLIRYSQHKFYDLTAGFGMILTVILLIGFGVFGFLYTFGLPFMFIYGVMTQK